jgi:hypothetical protein
MKILKLTLLISLISLNLIGQTCSYENLSRNFNFEVIPIPQKEDLIQIVVKVTTKANSKSVQTLTIACQGFYLDSFDDCKNVKSYTTKINSELPTGDENDSGNFIVGDFNFDGLEDFAIKSDPGGNGGPLYAYFIPIEINSAKRTITTFLHASAYQKNRRIFKYNPKAGKWKLIYDKLE